MKAFDEYYASEADLKKPADADADFDSDPSNEPIDRRFRRLLSPYAFNDVTVTEMFDIVRQLKRTICAHVWRCLTIFAFGAALAFDLAVLHTHFEPLPFDGWTLIAAPGHAIGGRGLGVAAASAAGSPLPYAAQLQLHHVVEASCSAALATYGWFGREPFAHWLMVPWLLKALSAWLARLFEVAQSYAGLVNHDEAAFRAFAIIAVLNSFHILIIGQVAQCVYLRWKRLRDTARLADEFQEWRGELNVELMSVEALVTDC